MAEKQNLPTLNLTRYGSNKFKKAFLKSVQQLPSLNFFKEKSINTIVDESHPAEKYIFGTQTTHNEFKKFVNFLFQGLQYSVHSLRGPSEEYLRRKMIRLPQQKQSKKKFLMLDLDQTLIHSVWGDEPNQVTIKRGQQSLRFNIRPYCLSFLEKISNFYEIYIFTASTQDYAQSIIGHLNSRKKTIQGILSRHHCLETHNGLRIKDLRIIKNRQLADIVIVDNLVHSFGLQIDNGIPILDFVNNKEDRQLLGLEKLLLELKDVPDVRQFLKVRLSLKKCLEINEEEFLSINIKKTIKNA